MSVNGSGAYELRHRGKVHRASGFSELKKWVLESRVSAEDEFRAAGSQEWLPVMGEPEFSEVLDPHKGWVVKMASGEYRARSFDTIVEWSKQGRISDDAVVEGPRTPPGGVRATALPALASNLVKSPEKREQHPVIRIDGREFTAPDTESVRRWIRESRVPVDAEISLEGKNWEPVSSCGLFDLEDWPPAAHGRIEEEFLPEMPVQRPSEPKMEEKPVTSTAQTEAVSEQLPSEQTFREIQEITEDDQEADDVPYTVVSANSEITVESVSELKHLLRNKSIFTYDEIKHPSFSEETISVGEFLDALKSPGRKPVFWISWGLLAAAICALALEYFEVLDLVTWLP